MTRFRFVKFLSFFVALVGALVIIGWIFDIGILKSVLPNLVEMKFVTALCFIAGGIVLYSAAEEQLEDSFVIQAILPAAILLILILMATLLITSIFGVSTSIDNLFIKENVGAINTVAPGRPSILSMINFVFVALVGILLSLGSRKHLQWIGSLVAIIGSIAVLGYIINQPILYYLVVGRTTAMALNTAILFILIGIGFALCEKAASKQS